MSLLKSLLGTFSGIVSKDRLQPSFVKEKFKPITYLLKITIQEPNTHIAHPKVVKLQLP